MAMTREMKSANLHFARSLSLSLSLYFSAPKSLREERCDEFSLYLMPNSGGETTFGVKRMQDRFHRKPITRASLA
jgi:hypothetical protein